MTGRDERERLLEIARAAVTACARGERFAEPIESDPPTRYAGAFVSLHRDGELRGCIGHVEADRPLPWVVADCARAACEDDPRFRRVGVPELDGLEIEISILGPLETVAAIESIVVGRHGLLVERGWRRGLLLPQVASAHRWTPQEFVEQTCQKAGLPHDAWRRGAAVWRFEAEVFSEGTVTPNDRAPDGIR